MSIQVKKYIGEKIMDMPSFPRAVTMSESENAETQAHVDRALTSISGKELDLTMGGVPIGIMQAEPQCSKPMITILYVTGSKS
jgi:hypothetical protein